MMPIVVSAYLWTTYGVHPIVTLWIWYVLPVVLYLARP